KPTAVSLVCGVIAPSSGRIQLAGRDATGLAPHVLVARGLVRTFQATTVYANRSVSENLLRGAYREIYPGFLPSLVGGNKARARRARAHQHVEEVMQWLALKRA